MKEQIKNCEYNGCKKQGVYNLVNLNEKTSFWFCTHKHTEAFIEEQEQKK